MWAWIFRDVWLWIALVVWFAATAALRFGGHRRWVVALSIVSASYVAIYLARWVSLFAMAVYVPAASLLSPGLRQDLVVWLQATVLVVVLAVVLVRLRPIVWVPLLVFGASTLLFGAWLTLNVEDWFPAQD